MLALSIGEGPRLVPSAGQKIPVKPGTFQEILLAENRFFQAGKGAENTRKTAGALRTSKNPRKERQSPLLRPRTWINCQSPWAASQRVLSKLWVMC
jgi:hypothetical protein